MMENGITCSVGIQPPPTPSSMADITNQSCYHVWPHEPSPQRVPGSHTDPRVVTTKGSMTMDVTERGRQRRHGPLQS